ncbi:DNA-3-methyladenine glycosylase [Streptacidiphilus jiangxiensis]|uniref:Putative 3-methyladenine DNA glycosylase n=1 Tax=Streptacidiphilus jiangxiensis TaxID=235985 RepID=A0A1H7VVZ1_STRJI|nr:DNA-3-methyladenine glycosylase [Streptacidiphilus jiangxiensis]SEM12918.1 DNA-3-methyladenine glycosylase [Streptacidiphilus jiangxiensis]
MALDPTDPRFLDRPSPEVAPDLLGRILVSTRPDGRVAVRITEVEAYTGPDDPASHAYRGRTARNAVMFGPPGFVYVYFTYGMHYCMNLVTGPGTTAGAVLLRAGEIVEGLGQARHRRPSARRDTELAQGPARLTQALGVARDQDGERLGGDVFRLLPGTPAPAERIRRGPRTGVAQAADTPYRFWIDGEPTVSPYRRHVRKRVD